MNRKFTINGIAAKRQVFNAKTNFSMNSSSKVIEGYTCLLLKEEISITPGRIDEDNAEEHFESFSEHN